MGALAACKGDVGARDVMRANMIAVRRVDVDDAGVLHDVDAPSDLSGPSPE
jgi:CTP:molybdopterin cytidylyltransferase MocA